MLIANSDGTFTAGPLDVLLILMDTARGTYHAAFLEESMFPGAILDVADTKLVRLKSKMHHTQGSTTFEGARVHLDELAKKIEVRDGNLCRDHVSPWNGSPFSAVVPNWVRDGKTFVESGALPFEKPEPDGPVAVTVTVIEERPNVRPAS